MTASLPQEYDPNSVEKAGSKLRGQIFGIGLSLAWALVFLVLGTCLFLGVELLTSIWITIASFAIVVLLSFFAEVIVEPSLEEVARQREEERIAREREEAPAAGGVLAAHLSLTGGADEGQPNAVHSRTAGFVGAIAAKGRRLDVTLPEEQTAPPRAASGAVGGPQRPVAAPPRAGTPPPPSTGVPAAPSAPASAQEEGFQDLASLLKEAAQPSPVPVRQR